MVTESEWKEFVARMEKRHQGPSSADVKEEIVGRMRALMRAGDMKADTEADPYMLIRIERGPDGCWSVRQLECHRMNQIAPETNLLDGDAVTFHLWDTDGTGTLSEETFSQLNQAPPSKGP